MCKLSALQNYVVAVLECRLRKCMLVWFMHVAPTSDTIIYHCAAVVDTPLAVDPQIQSELASLSTNCQLA